MPRGPFRIPYRMAMHPGLNILFEDNHCLAVAKPAPLLTQGVPPGRPHARSPVKAYLRSRYHKPGNVYLGIPHRLDRPVSGVVLFARNTKAGAATGRAVPGAPGHQGLLGRRRGRGSPDEGVWEDWLLKIAEERAGAMCTSPERPGAKRAVLRYRRLAADVDDGTLLEVQPETGRMHQIRVQARTRGWPVRGDVLYGAGKPFGPPAELPRDRVIALHARSLTFLHPIRYEPITVVAPLPEYWQPLALDL